MGLWKRISRSLIAAEPAAPRGKAGCRAYAVGDVHGRLDLLDRMLAEIERDRLARPSRKTFVIFLGDLIDRGPDSAGVVERLRHYSPLGARPVFLAGNHEEVMLRILQGDVSLIQPWLKFGGSQTLASYGLDPDAIRHLDDAGALRSIRAGIPAEHRAFLESFADTFSFGDYLFVHAGIRPGVAIGDQDRKDLLWIRDPFLNDAKEHGFVVVHGHTIVDKVEERRNRIGIDTGAYQTGVLTALAVEDDRRWFLATAPVSLASAAA